MWHLHAGLYDMCKYTAQLLAVEASYTIHESIWLAVLYQSSIHKPILVIKP